MPDDDAAPGGSRLDDPDPSEGLDPSEGPGASDGPDVSERPEPHPHLHHLKQVVDAELHEAQLRARDTRERLRDAAIQAELETGRREDTLEEARAGVLKRTVRMGTGSMVLGLGIVMIPLPGPGLLVVAAGLAILSRDVAWAERLLERVRKRLPQDEEGGVSKPVIATSVVVALAAVATSVWFMAR